MMEQVERNDASGRPAAQASLRAALRTPALCGLLAALALLATAGLLGADYRVAQAVRNHLPAWAHRVSDGISLLGLSGCYAIPAVFLFVWSGWIRPRAWLWRACLWLLTAEAACALLVRVLKIVFGRWRPERTLAGQFEFFQLSSKCHSFPSGHTADAAVVAAVLWFVLPRLRPLWVAWVVLMAASRIGAKQHFLADAATGAILGILCALAVGGGVEALDRRLRARLQLPANPRADAS
jgi:membrane-associated phospholipid phosphatase